MNWNVLQPIALALRSNGTYEPFSSEAWKYAGEMTLLGMGMIFAVLSLLWGVLAIFKLVFVGKTQKSPKEKTDKAALAEQKAQRVASPVAEPQPVSADSGNDTELVAILTAAIAAYRQGEGTQGGFRVVSFKRAGGRAWNTRK